VNPDNDYAKRKENENGINRVYFEECVAYNVPLMFKVFSSIIAIFGLTSLGLLWNPANENLDQYREYE